MACQRVDCRSFQILHCYWSDVGKFRHFWIMEFFPMGLLNYISLARKLYLELRKQKRFNKSFLVPYLSELENRFQGKFRPEQKERILGYYGLFIPSFLCSSYKRLGGKTLSEEERKRATLFGILTPVGDDLFDIDHLDISQIREIALSPESYRAESFSAKVAREIQLYELTSVPFPKEYLEASKNVLEIQIETLRQKQKNITPEQLEHITCAKGADSVIIFHQCLDETADPAMLECLYLIGSLYQLGNDIFDLYKDVRDNIYNLINTCDDFNKLRTYFLEKVREQNQRILGLSFPEKNKKEFCIIVNVINARSMVGLDQFVRLQEKKGHKIDWWESQRKEMIIDMEKPKNILRWMQYLRKLSALR